MDTNLPDGSDERIIIGPGDPYELVPRCTVLLRELTD
jgi:hypothetical protein